MSRNTSININGDKFYEWALDYCKRHDYTFKEFCNKIGFNDNFIANTKARNKISNQAAALLKAIYGKDYEDFLDVVKEPEVKQEQNNIEQILLRQNELLESIYSVQLAMLKFWERDSFYTDKEEQ